MKKIQTLASHVTAGVVRTSHQQDITRGGCTGREVGQEREATGGGAVGIEAQVIGGGVVEEYGFGSRRSGGLLKDQSIPCRESEACPADFEFVLR